MAKGVLLAACLLPSLSVAAELAELTYITEEYPPYSYRHEGRAAGQAVELLDALFRLTETPLTRDAIRFYPWARGYELALNEPGTVLFSTTWTPQRAPLFHWVGPIARDRVVLIARRDRHLALDSLDDLLAGDYRVAVVHEDIGAQRLHEAGLPEHRIQETFSGTSALRMLDRRRVDLWAYSEAVAAWLMREHGLPAADYEAVYAFDTAELYFALHRNTDPALVQTLQNALTRLRAESPAPPVFAGLTAAPPAPHQRPERHP